MSEVDSLNSTAAAGSELQDGCSTRNGITSLEIIAEFVQVRVSRAKVFNCVDVGGLRLGSHCAPTE